MWLFINCLIENPTFDSQTKEYMTLEQIGDKCLLTNDFITNIIKNCFLEKVKKWIQSNNRTDLEKETFKSKQSEIKGLSTQANTRANIRIQAPTALTNISNSNNVEKMQKKNSNESQKSIQSNGRNTRIINDVIFKYFYLSLRSTRTIPYVIWYPIYPKCDTPVNHTGPPEGKIKN
jgi:Rps23 Pro-64 3,4-dihydroxylase Tpa1-like proline 4-hydroxylase